LEQFTIRQAAKVVGRDQLVQMLQENARPPRLHGGGSGDDFEWSLFIMPRAGGDG
jgi:hypothetical protein